METHMKIYQVGGSVRDQLLGLTAKDRDWVVVGANPQALLSQGYLQVGADFPVFLHPQTNEEYALARLERKTGDSYLGFEVDTSGVTLEEDLSRRDLTVNAMAMNEAGELIDPFNGAGDLQQRVLRHVGPAFSEDPVRILRVLRFHARFGPAWTIAPQTWQLLQHMVQAGDASHLVAERVWKEVARALMEPHPQLFVQGLLALGMTKLPAFAAYAAADAASATRAGSGALAQASLPVRAVVAFAMESSSACSSAKPPVGIPSEVWRLARAVQRFPRAPSEGAAAWEAMFAQCAAYKDPGLVNEVFQVWRCRDLPCGAAHEALQAALAVDGKCISASMPAGPEVGRALAAARAKAIEQVL